MLDLSGVHLPVATPFSDNGGLATASFMSNLDDWLSHDVAGVVVAGSTGEAPLLQDAELFTLVELAADRIEEKRLTVGTGGESTRVVLDRNRAVAERGAHAALVRSPYYYRPAMSPAVLRDHFLRVADESPIPIVLYHIPKFVDVDLAPELVGRLVEHENIIGIKDSRGDLGGLGAFIEACGSNGQVLVGSGALLYAALEAGAAGGILGVAIIAARSTAALYRAWKDGDHARAGAMQERIGPLHDTIVVGCGIPGVKAALDRIGLYGGSPRSPLPGADDAKRKTVDDALEKAGLGIAKV